MIGAPQARKHPALNVALQLWSTHRWTILWYWLIFVLVMIVICIFMYSAGPEKIESLDESYWLGSGGFSPKIFLLVIGILMTPVSLASFVSNGVTRKHFVAGSTLLMAALALLSSLVFAAGSLLESLVVDWIGFTVKMEHPPLFRVLVEQFFLFAGYSGTGWLIGSAFYRYHWRVGVIISVLSFVPITVMEILADSAGIVKLFDFSITPPALNFGLSAVLLAVITAALVALNYYMLRKVPIKRKLI